mgnify:CR=1 FL=1
MAIHPCPTVTPLAQRRARAFVDVTHTDAARFHPALAAAQGAALKSARGQAVDLDRLTPAHLIGPDISARPDTGFRRLGDIARPDGRGVMSPDAVTRMRRRIAQIGAVIRGDDTTGGDAA